MNTTKPTSKTASAPETRKYTPDTYQTPSEVEAAYRAEGRHAEADAYAGKTGEGDVPRVLEGGLNEAFRVIANLNQECEAWKESHNALLKEKDLYAKLLDETEAQRDELLAALKQVLDQVSDNGAINLALGARIEGLIAKAEQH